MHVRLSVLRGLVGAPVPVKRVAKGPPVLVTVTLTEVGPVGLGVFG